ncbi:YCII-related [Ostreococcus tauri]|uniref:YCII-related n=2 Tax=Ostreococcus tauri TaxID=70448 RepID=A0A090M999_OSTTA|nr:YCII-related [Ostreococcus tauri]CEF98724.1 YCII-related [Ostreococcus tauri]|eukprot:XP_022839434.1 YCII-related [Ostreococcus tauri]
MTLEISHRVSQNSKGRSRGTNMRTCARANAVVDRALARRSRKHCRVVKSRSSAVAMSAAPSNSYWLLTLNYVENMAERRGPYREEHLAGASASHAKGECVMAGALTDPVDTGVFVFKNCDESVVRAFAENDAYVKNGLVTSWNVRPWTVVVGN